MNIIEEESETKLIQAIKSLKELEGLHCVHIHPAHGKIKHTRQAIITQVQEHLTGANLYACKDGEFFLLTNSSLSICEKAMLEIARAIKAQTIDHIGELYGLGKQTGKLLKLLEKKIEQSQEIEKEAAKQQKQAEEAAVRKRHEILDQDVRKSAEQIATQRRLRNKPIFMIVEDDPFSRRLVENVLQNQYQLVSLASAETALSAYAELAPDLLFLDINLPDVTGHELLEKIITLDPKAYVVMLSGNSDRTNVMQAVEHGAVGFIAKPFSREKLFQYIDRCPTIGKKKAV